MLPVHTAVACSDQLGRPDESDTGGLHDGGDRVCNIEARIYDYTETVFIDTSGTAMTARAEHGCNVSGVCAITIPLLVQYRIPP